MFFRVHNGFGEAESVRVVIQSLENHPVCKHGPALLFERRTGSKIQQFYACSAYRDQTECSLYVPIEQPDTKVYHRDLLARNVEKSSEMAKEKSSLLQKVGEVENHKKVEKFNEI